MRKELLTFQDPKSPVSEIFRTLRTNIQFMNTSKKMKTLLITSTFPEEGKSWITANLAVTFAQAGKKVILVDADMRKGRQYKIFDVLPKPGLSNYLSNMDSDEMETEDVNVTNYIQETGVENLHILVAGNVPPNPSELLVSSRLRDLLTELKDKCDLIIIDGTPCDLVSDSIILSRFVDYTVVVTAQKETKKDSLERIVKNIQNVGGKIAGVIVNKIDMSTKKYNQSYYYGSMTVVSKGKNRSKHTKYAKNSEETIKDLFSKINQEDDNEAVNMNIDSDIKSEPSINFELKSEPEYKEDDYIQKIKEIEVEPKPKAEPKAEPKLEKVEVVKTINFDNTNILSNEPIEEFVKQSEPTHIDVFKTINEETVEQNYNHMNNTYEMAESAKDMPQEKAQEIIDLVNNYIETEKQKQERKN